MSTPDTSPGDRWVGVTEAALYLSTSTDTIRRRVRDGSLPVTRLGTQLRIRVADLDALLTSEPAR